MHPLIRIVCFIVFAAFVSVGQVSFLVIATMLLFITWFVSKQWPSNKAWKMLRRMRIFYLSILIIYLWFTPGEIMFSLFENWSPTYEGLTQAMIRIFALCLLVFGVETLLRLTPRELLLTGLYYLVTPLVILGFSREQFIIRLMLTFDKVSSDEVKNSAAKKQEFKQYLFDVTQRLADNIASAIQSKTPLAPMIFELQAPPTALQWAWPVCLTFLFLSVR